MLFQNISKRPIPRGDAGKISLAGLIILSLANLEIGTSFEENAAAQQIPGATPYISWSGKARSLIKDLPQRCFSSAKAVPNSSFLLIITPRISEDWCHIMLISGK